MQALWNTIVDNVVYLLVLFPLLGACLVHVMSSFGAAAIRRSALTNILLTCGLAVVMVANYDPVKSIDTDTLSLPANAAQLFQMISDAQWVAELGSGNETRGLDIRFTVGVDGISLWFIVLTVLLTYAVITATPSDVHRPATYYSLILLLESCLIGVFAALDVVLFCIFLELSMLPLFFLVGWWGGYQRRSAVRTFYLYNLLGTLLVTAGLMGVVLACGWMGVSSANSMPRLTFSIPQLLVTFPQRLIMGGAQPSALYWEEFQQWTFFCLLFGFLLKVPLIPIHRWFAESNSLASWPISALFSAVVIKLGVFGILRFLLPLFPGRCLNSFETVSAVVVAAAIFAALLAINQRDLKLMLTYTWISQVSFCLLGILTLNATGVSGGILQLVNHGLSSACLILLFGFVSREDRERDSRPPRVYGRSMVVSTLVLVSVLSLIGVPGLNGFVGESMLLYGIFASNPAHATWTLFGYLLLAWALVAKMPKCVDTRPQQTMSAGVRSPGLDMNGDLRFREIAAVAPLAALIVAIGILPQFFIDRIEPSVSATLYLIRIH